MIWYIIVLLQNINTINMYAPCDSIKSKVWFRQWVGPDTCCLTPIEFRMSMNADSNASFLLSIWIFKSPTIKTLSAASTNSDRKSPNSWIKSVWCPGGLYTIASTNITGDLSLLLFSLDNVIWSTITSKELCLKPVFWEILRILL